jgi:hypothetical protein
VCPVPASTYARGVSSSDVDRTKLRDAAVCSWRKKARSAHRHLDNAPRRVRWRKTLAVGITVDDARATFQAAGAPVLGVDTRLVKLKRLEVEVVADGDGGFEGGAERETRPLPRLCRDTCAKTAVTDAAAALTSQREARRKRSRNLSSAIRYCSRSWRAPSCVSASRRVPMVRSRARMLSGMLSLQFPERAC